MKRARPYRSRINRRRKRTAFDWWAKQGLALTRDMERISRAELERRYPEPDKVFVESTPSGGERSYLRRMWDQINSAPYR